MKQWWIMPSADYRRPFIETPEQHNESIDDGCERSRSVHVIEYSEYLKLEACLNHINLLCNSGHGIDDVFNTIKTEVSKALSECNKDIPPRDMAK